MTDEFTEPDGSSENYPDFRAWLDEGKRLGWVGPAVCYTHDGLPMSGDEEDEFYEGDPCIHVLRLYSSYEEKIKIEENHSPSQWRV